MLENLNTKCITDFVAGDTIYMTVSTERGKNSIMYLCKFVKMEGPFVVGEKIESTVNKDIHRGETGDVIKVRLSACSLYGKDPVTGHTSFHGFKPTGYAMYPSDKISENGGTIKDHPSYGMIGFSHGNVNGEGSRLFGSKLLHNDVITITLKSAEHDRHLNNDWYHAKEVIAEVRLSATQFAQFITMPNRGDGVPCTVMNVMGTSMPETPTDALLKKHADEFKATMRNMTVDMREKLDMLNLILSKQAIGKGDREEIKSLFNGFLTEIESKVPFIQAQFGEELDKAVQSAKIEMEMFAEHRGFSSGNALKIAESLRIRKSDKPESEE
jgi:hypothetical protein